MPASPQGEALGAAAPVQSRHSLPLGGGGRRPVGVKLPPQSASRTAPPVGAPRAAAPPKPSPPGEGGRAPARPGVGPCLPLGGGAQSADWAVGVSPLPGEQPFAPSVRCADSSPGGGAKGGCAAKALSLGRGWPSASEVGCGDTTPHQSPACFLPPQSKIKDF